VHASLVLFTLWPLAHIWLTIRFDMSPWKLCGWGMYSEPRFGMLGMEIAGRVSGTGDEQRLDAPSPELQGLANEYLERYRWLRRLAHPAISRAALRCIPGDQVRVMVFRLARPASGMVAMSNTEEVVPRIGDSFHRPSRF
jgi:hypothetical protein